MGYHRKLTSVYCVVGISFSSSHTSTHQEHKAPCFRSYNFNRWPHVWNQQVTERRTRQARLWRYRRLSGTAGSVQLHVLISPGLQFMAIIAVYFQPLWWILLNYWPLWGRDGFASVLQIAGHHCDIQVKSTWHTEQVLTDYESECKASRLIIICRISGWGVLIGSKYYVTKETNSKSITCNVIDPQAITKMMSL